MPLAQLWILKVPPFDKLSFFFWILEVTQFNWICTTQNIENSPAAHGGRLLPMGRFSGPPSFIRGPWARFSDFVT